jgi:hypothetical protein
VHSVHPLFNAFVAEAKKLRDEKISRESLKEIVEA